MFGAIDASLLFDLAKRAGYMEQLKFDFPPVVYIHPDYACDVPVSYSFDSMSTLSHVDHPAFSALRNTLENRGYIKTERSWSNGDYVTKPFFLNRIYFEEGDKFYCAAAMKWQLQKVCMKHSVSIIRKKNQFKKHLLKMI